MSESVIIVVQALANVVLAGVVISLSSRVVEQAQNSVESMRRIVEEAERRRFLK